MGDSACERKYTFAKINRVGINYFGTFLILTLPLISARFQVGWTNTNMATGGVEKKR
jgi:hypothetical protein